MAKLTLVINIPDDKFNYEHYPSDCKSPKDCIQFDIEQMDEGALSETEFIDNYLYSGVEVESITVS